MQAQAIAILFATFVALAASPAHAGGGSGDDDDDFYDPKPEYIWGGNADNQYDSAQSACQAGVKDLAKKDKWRFDTSHDGATDDVKVCVFKSGDGDIYESNIKLLEVCHDKTEANQEHGGHTMCRCKDGEKGCKKSKTDPDKANSAPKANPTNYCLAKYKANDKTRKPVSVADAKKVSDENEAIMAAEANVHDDGHGILWAYNRQKDITGANNGRFPTFDPATDFYPGRPNDVNIGTLCGTRTQDFAAANAIAGLKCIPIGYTWHHHQDLGRMQLVKSSEHADEDHAGGVSIWKAAFCDKDPKAPKTAPALCKYPPKESLPKHCATP